MSVFGGVKSPFKKKNEVNKESFSSGGKGSFAVEDRRMQSFVISCKDEDVNS